ncbi:cation:proton antiporter [Paraconexibacter antarcticus]|uniref:Cation:proton antiporter n=1 Tax=Paraconexibacter antarcticus TaxID=2949664 RepID=A0ABY5DXW2_9ACTN|nr:cation:proton antiporter [Paraconexibacter antarcticus]UTI65986.1 cation:proton antiporter [Paraconexibacter antarcticus]
MSFGSLALVMAGGLLGPVLAGFPRLTVPLVVGELLAGILIGRTGFGWVDPSRPELAFLGEIGFAVLMLIAGTHLPLRTPGLRGALRSGAVGTVLAAVLAIPVAILLHRVTPLHDTGILVLLLATSSAAIVMPVLADGPEGPAGMALVAVAWVALADVATVIAIPVVLANGHVGRVVLGSVLVLVGATAVYVVVRITDARNWLERAERRSLERGWALRLRLSLVALFALAWLATEYGTSILIAGFGIGAVIALLGEPRSIAQELIGVGEGFLVPVFFVLLGARLDVRALFNDPANLGLLAALLASIVAVHVAVALVTRAGLATGLLTSAQLGVPAAITSLGLSNGSVQPGQGAAIVTAAIGSVGVAAIGAQRLRAGAATDAVGALVPAEVAGAGGGDPGERP